MMNLEKIRAKISGFEMDNFYVFDTINSLSFETEKDFLNGKEYFYISPMDFQGYELGDRENEEFRLHCYDIEIKRCEKLK